MEVVLLLYVIAPVPEPDPSPVFGAEMIVPVAPRRTAAGVTVAMRPACGALAIVTFSVLEF
jgi:hypothetical protein